MNDFHNVIARLGIVNQIEKLSRVNEGSTPGTLLLYHLR